MRQLNTALVSAPHIDLEMLLAQAYNQGWMDISVYHSMIQRALQNGRVVIIPAMEGMIEPDHLEQELLDSVMGYHDRMSHDEDD